VIAAKELPGRALRSLGRAGVAALVLLAASIAFLSLVLRPLEARQDALQEQLESLAKRRIRADAGLLAVATPAAKLNLFYGFFQQQAELTDYLAQLYSIGAQTGVELRTAEYRLSDPAHLRLAEYTIVLPITGNYAEVRAFLENALQQIPVLTLDRASFRRKKVGDTTVEADVKMAIFLSQP